ncbi:MAG: 2'-5' RNA ligase family protein [Myxococcota bacterium]
MASVFVAFPVEAGDWLERLPAAPDAIRLVHRADLHVTVAFLGRVEPTQADAAWATLQGGLPAPCAGRLGRVEAMGPARTASALAARVLARDEAGETLATVLGWLRDRALAAADRPADSRPPHPHLTLARIARRADRTARREALAWAASIDVSTVHVRLDRLALYASRAPAQRSARPAAAADREPAYEMLRVVPLAS